MSCLLRYTYKMILKIIKVLGIMKGTEFIFLSYMVVIGQIIGQLFLKEHITIAWIVKNHVQLHLI